MFTQKAGLADQEKTGVNNPSRSAHLDGLRGLASLMVFMGHLMITVLPSISTLQSDAGNMPVLIEIGKTPLSFLWGGDFGVCIFFVLSGYVLSQFCLTTKLGFVAKLGRRYVRLALPMAFSTILAYVLLKSGAFFNYEASTTISHSPWFARWYQMPPSLWNAIGEGFWSSFINGRSDYNCNLWTMQMELVASAAIFLVYSLVQSQRLRCLVLVIAICLAPGYYLLFPTGCLLFELFELEMLAPSDRTSFSIELAAIGVLLVGILAGGFPASGTHTRISSPWHRWLSDSDNSLMWHMIGAILVLIAVQQSKLLRAALGSRPMQVLGQWSFPIYLIQIPLFCSFTALVMLKLPIHDYLTMAVTTIVSTILVMVPLAWLTYRFVEVPTVQASRAVGKFINNFIKY